MLALSGWHLLPPSLPSLGSFQCPPCFPGSTQQGTPWPEALHPGASPAQQAGLKAETDTGLCPKVSQGPQLFPKPL